MREVKKLVERLRDKYKTNDPFTIANELGIWIYKCPLGKINGHYIYAKRKKVFFINNELTMVGQLITCAHELGHSLLHSKDIAYFSTNNYLANKSFKEMQCNVFATELLQYLGLTSYELCNSSLSISDKLPKNLFNIQ